MNKRIEFNRIQKVYSGRPGCMCGCKGKYSDSDRSKKIIFNKIARNPDAQVDEHAKCIYVETDTRMLAAYFD
jgi:hypothetical protein